MIGLWAIHLASQFLGEVIIPCKVTHVKCQPQCPSLRAGTQFLPRLSLPFMESKFQRPLLSQDLQSPWDPHKSTHVTTSTLVSHSTTAYLGTLLGLSLPSELPCWACKPHPQPQTGCPLEMTDLSFTLTALVTLLPGPRPHDGRASPHSLGKNHHLSRREWSRGLRVGRDS